MPFNPRILPLSIAAIQAARTVGALLGLCFLTVLAATFIAEARLSTRVLDQYGEPRRCGVLCTALARQPGDILTFEGNDA